MIIAHMTLMKCHSLDVIVMIRKLKYETALRLAQCHDYLLGNTSLIALEMVNNLRRKKNVLKDRHDNDSEGF